MFAIGEGDVREGGAGEGEVSERFLGGWAGLAVWRGGGGGGGQQKRGSCDRVQKLLGVSSPFPLKTKVACRVMFRKVKTFSSVTTNSAATLPWSMSLRVHGFVLTVRLQGRQH